MKYVLESTSTGQRLEIAEQRIYVIGRNAKADLTVQDSNCSRRHFQLSARGDECFVAPLSDNNPTFLNGSRIFHECVLPTNSEIIAGSIRFRFYAKDTGEEQVVNAPTVLIGADEKLRRVTIAESKVVREGSAITIGRDKDYADLHLEDIQVSRLHAEVRRETGVSLICDLGSSNGTFVNGSKIGIMPVELHPRDRIDIGPYSIEFDGERITPLASARNNISLIAQSLSRHVPFEHVETTGGRSGIVGGLEILARIFVMDKVILHARRLFRSGKHDGKSKTLLDDVNLCILPGEFACIIGPSGAGKSTLLRALSNRENWELNEAGSGQVLINQKDLHLEFQQLKQQLAYVPQHEVLHDYLTVSEALRFAGRLRLPRDVTGTELSGRIDTVLNLVSLIQERDSMICTLSGGQRKRAIVATEILAEPSLLFLDEVTSGLDEATDRELMGLFRKVANEGKTVVSVTHSLANVEPFCSIVIVLAPGGHLVFIGSPSEAIDFFDVSRLPEIYDLLKRKGKDSDEFVELWERFKNSPYCETYITKRIHSSKGVRAGSPPKRTLEKFETESFRRHWPILLGRCLKLLQSDQQAIRSWIVQCVLVGILLVWVFGDVSGTENFQNGSQGRLGFFLILSTLWFGCNNSARQIVRERSIFLQERDVGLNMWAYFFSKLLPLWMVTTAQSFLIFFAAFHGCRYPGDVFMHLLIASAVAFAGTSLGLCISSWSKSEEVAIGFVPIVLIPQIILANCLMPLDGTALSAAKIFVTAYWGFDSEAIVLEGEVKNDIDLQLELILPVTWILVHAFCLISLGLSRLGVVKR